MQTFIILGYGSPYIRMLKEAEPATSVDVEAATQRMQALPRESWLAAKDRYAVMVTDDPEDVIDVCSVDSSVVAYFALAELWGSEAAE